MSFFKSSILNLKLKANSYFNGEAYEEDLNTIINLIHSHHYHYPDFESYELEERIKEKKLFLINQATKLILAGAIKGATTAIQKGQLNFVGEYVIIGVAGALFIIVVTVTGVMIRRISLQESLNLGRSKPA
ncbi:MAG: hypothetical protein AB7I27_11300 [Bacteriovoracaceae bacterium]